MDFQRVRNLTTRKLHTDIGHVYQDLEYLVGVKGIMTHQIPAALRAIAPWLVCAIPDRRFWDNLHDPLHAGDLEIEPMGSGARDRFFLRMRMDSGPL